MKTVLELVRRKVIVADLELGMFVCDIDRPWSETPFLFQGFPLLDQNDLDAVRKICQFVYIDDTRRLVINTRHTVSMPTKIETTRRRRRTLSKEIDNAKKVHLRGAQLITDVFAEIRFGRGINTTECRTFVHQCVDSVLHNESALIWLTRIKTRDDYTGKHCLSVAILAIGFARYLGHSDEELEQIGLSGLLHDVGKIQVDQDILNKPGKLNENEFSKMKAHAQLGYDLLAGHKDLAPVVIDVARSHHERYDGGGYPRQLKGEAISYHARLISICDTYDAITSHRVYDGARPPKEAFRIFMEGREKQFDATLVMQFIEWLGVFPVGTLVQLRNGQVGIVLETRKRQRLRPRIVVLRDENQKICVPKYMDLSHVSAQDFGERYRIVESLPDGSHGILLSDPDVQAVLNADALSVLDLAQT